MANVRCTVIWNGSEYRVEGECGLTVSGVWDKFFVAHSDLVHLKLVLFNMGGMELPLDDRIFNGDVLVLRPRVVH